MATAENTELIDRFEEFYRNYYRNEIGELAQKYPNDQKSLYIDWDELYRFDPDLADDYRTKPSQIQEFAEEALRLYDLPVDVSLGQAHVRVRNLPDSEDIRDIRHEHHGNLISVQGIVRKATDVRPKVTEAAFECQRCGTLSRIPQAAGDFQEPHECQGCERQGPFRLNTDQSQFIDAQKIRVQESPEGLRGGETPQSIDINVEDDITGTVTAGDHVRATGILKLDQQGSDQDKSPMFDIYMDGVSIVIEDEQFEDMDITDAEIPPRRSQRGRRWPVSGDGFRGPDSQRRWFGHDWHGHESLEARGTGDTVRNPDAERPQCECHAFSSTICTGRPLAIDETGRRTLGRGVSCCSRLAAW